MNRFGTPAGRDGSNHPVSGLDGPVVLSDHLGGLSGDVYVVGVHAVELEGDLQAVSWSVLLGGDALNCRLGSGRDPRQSPTRPGTPACQG